VSCYALFKGWLLLSQPPTCLRRNTSLSLSLHFGTLSGDLGSFPRVHEALPSRTHCLKYHKGIRSLAGHPTHKGTENQSVLYPLCYFQALSLKTFRGEPAITRLGKLFTSNHSSSGDVALSIGSDLLSSFLTDSSWPWLARLASGLTYTTYKFFTLRPNSRRAKNLSSRF
jgi:hypothetical protein